MQKDSDGGSRPVPDPTVLTTDAVKQAVEIGKDYTDGKVAVLEQRLADMDRATAVLNETVTRTPTEIEREIGHLRELLFAEVEADRRGLAVAGEEREKAARQLTEEREKVAKALAASMAREIQSGDERLADHVDQQVEQLRGLIESVRREAGIIHQASETAIAKAEELNKERWEGNNKWRDQSADRERSQQQEMANLSSTFMRKDTAEAQYERIRENADAQFGELRRTIAELATQVSKLI
ncbi:MAG TPA: hypothetical protein VFT13_03700 [Candidatus Krumholzibacteria bacterium]|nr:hypothetical protein [Candidatus Krumholzibacteria bacterium]